MQYLGISQQEPALPVVRLIAPTDIQEVAWKMGEYIGDRHSWDWINPSMWRIVGFESGNIIDFLQRYILVARQWKEPLTRENQDRFSSHFLSEYDYRESDLSEIFEAFFAIREAGLMPDTIYRPWSYEGTTLAEDIGAAAGKAVLPLGILAIAAVAVYAFFSKGAPAIAIAKTP